VQLYGTDLPVYADWRNTKWRNRRSLGFVLFPRFDPGPSAALPSPRDGIPVPHRSWG